MSRRKPGEAEEGEDREEVSGLEQQMVDISKRLFYIYIYLYYLQNEVEDVPFEPQITAEEEARINSLLNEEQVGFRYKYLYIIAIRPP